MMAKSVEKTAEHEKPYKTELFWRNIIAIGFLHIGAVYGAYLLFTSAKLATILFTIFLYYFTGAAVTAGAHRLWSHRSYKAKWPLRLLLAFAHTMAFQYSVINWVRDHRLHHKYSDTNADPHNINRGFFFSHLGWLMCRKHPEVKDKGKNIDISDLYTDPILRFQKRYYVPLVLLICFYLPAAMPVYFWNESWKNAFYLCSVLRWVVVLNAAMSINSVAHRYGQKPYDKNIDPVENTFLAIVTAGEGWHNYHHAFPWDYKTAETARLLNGGSFIIESFAKIGWAYDLKSASAEVIRKRAERTGDGNYEILQASLKM